MKNEYDEKIEAVKILSTEMLVDFDRFCRENDLQYYISFGSCLGAIRHGGFIPWDDDVDVDMPIWEYRKFEKLWMKKGNQETYFLQTKKTDPDILLSFPRLRRNDTAWIDPGCEKIPIHWGVPIDIFPFYHAARGRKLQKIQRKLHQETKKNCAFAWEHPDASAREKRKKWRATRFWLWTEERMSALCAGSGKLYFPWGCSKDGKVIAAETILPTKPLLFEGKELMGPADCDAYLTWSYGDYMTPPPENERGGHAIGILDLENDGEKYTGVRRRN